MLENFDPHTIVEEGVRRVVLYLMNLVEKLFAKVQEQAEEIERLRDEINRGKRGTGQAEDQGKQTSLPDIVGEGTPGVQSSSQRKQAGQGQDRSGGGVEGGSGTPASRCPIQRLRRSHRTGRGVSHREHPVSQRELLLA